MLAWLCVQKAANGLCNGQQERVVWYPEQAFRAQQRGAAQVTVDDLVDCQEVTNLGKRGVIARKDSCQILQPNVLF